MKIPRLAKLLPSWKNLLLAVFAALLLILAFPDFEYWFLAWFALVPLMWAVEREKASTAKSSVIGWIFGTIFFFGTCWWLTFAPIHYAGFPPILAYFLLFCVTTVTGLFPGIFAAILSVLLRRFGSRAFLAAPVVWVACEFARYWITGNNWNGVGYSQAFRSNLVEFAVFGGVLAVSWLSVIFNAIFYVAIRRRGKFRLFLLIPFFFLGIAVFPHFPDMDYIERHNIATMVVLQANVPMAGLTSQNWNELRQRHIQLAEAKLKEPKPFPGFIEKRNTNAVIFPESPMNFMYSDDREFQQFIGDFARRNNVSVLFNSSERDIGTTKYFNSAVMVGPDGKQVAQYDKLYLLPFGEAVPWFLEGIVPGFVGNFAYGREYDLFPVGDAKAGVMICFESHFGALSREYVRNGADVIIEMTNDGYLGPTPVLRQHLANAVFRAVETNRPVLRVTNVGITAYIDEKGRVLDATEPYQEDARVWSVSKSDGSQTFYVKYGDWFAWLCSLITTGLLIFGLSRKSPTATNNIA